MRDFNGSESTTPSGKPIRLAVNESKLKGIMNALRSLFSFADRDEENDNFFDEQPGTQGVLPMRDGMIVITAVGLSKRTRTPDDRTRHAFNDTCDELLAASGDPGPLLQKLLNGSFEGDTVKARAFRQLVAPAVGSFKFNDPRLLVLEGNGANNGKSQVLDMVVSLVPPGASFSYDPCGQRVNHATEGLEGRRLLVNDDLADIGVRVDELKSLTTGGDIICNPKGKRQYHFRNNGLVLLATNHTIKPLGGHADQRLSATSQHPAL